MDIRVPMEPIARAFGVPATVTGEWDSPISASVVWLRPKVEESEVGSEYAVRGARWVVAIRQDEVPLLKRGSIIRSAGPSGDTVRSRKVDGMELVDREFWYAIVSLESGVT